MPNKKLLIMFPLILLIGFTIFNNQNNNIKSIDSKKPDIQSKQKSITANHQKGTGELNDSSKSPSEIIEDSTQKEITTTFDSDPFVDKEIIAQKFKHCSQLMLMFDRDEYKNFMGSIYSRLRESKPDVYDKYLNHCLKLNAKHPEFGIEVKKNLDNMQPSTYLGRLMSDDKFAEYEFENNADSIKNALIRANPNLLFTFYADLAYFRFVPDLRKTIASQQNDYGVIIGKYAKILFACRRGADCGENSAIVFDTCLSNNDLCANNIEELIKTRFSKGQQADIELGYQHLVDFYDNVD